MKPVHRGVTRGYTPYRGVTRGYTPYDWYLLVKDEQEGGVREIDLGYPYHHDPQALETLKAIEAEFEAAREARRKARKALFESLTRIRDHAELEALLRADQARYEAAYERASSDEALKQESERDRSSRPRGRPSLRLSSGVEVGANEVAATWRALQEIATSGEDSADLLHELLRSARNPRYRPGKHAGRLRALGLLTHWGMLDSVREVVLASLYEIEHGELVEYKLVPPPPLSVSPEEL